MAEQMMQNELIKKLQELAFVKCELELFLDTHPESAVALENYKECVRAYNAILMEYTEKYGPISAADVKGGKWTWTNDPWPWQHEFPHNMGHKPNNCAGKRKHSMVEMLEGMSKASKTEGRK